MNLRLPSIAVLLAAAPFLRADPSQPQDPPTSWIDPDTGHRVIRLTREAGSDSFYFNFNSLTPDGKEMVYTTPEGIAVLNLATLEARQVVKGPARAIVVGHRTPTIYFTRGGEREGQTLWAADIRSGAARKLADLPKRASVATINADETLGAGAFVEGDANAQGAYDGTRSRAVRAFGSKYNMGEPLNKGQMMRERLAARLPMTLFTVDLATGKIHALLEHQTDWLNHFQFSPTEPTLLMYCHEGPWQLVDRIWLIRTDGTGNQLIHKRSIENEIDGHEWWGADGNTIFYQLHYPAGMQSSFIASYNVRTGERVWCHYTPDMTSIHDNSSPDGKLFCGDGDPKAPWIFLLRPVLDKDNGTLGEHLIKGGYLKAEKLVNMSKHEYHLEPNPFFTADMKWIVFRSNMFGPDYAFAVEVAKAKEASGGAAAR